MKLGRIALRNINRNKKRSLLSVLSTAIATFAIVFMFSFIAGMVKDMKDMSFNYETGQLVIRIKDYDDKVYSQDLAVDNYKSVLSLLIQEYPDYQYSPRLKFPSTVLDGNRTIICFGVAADIDRETDYLDLDDKLIEGRLPAEPLEVLMGFGLAKELNKGVGDKFTPITTTRRGASSGITFKISGLAKFSNSAYTNKTFISPITDIPGILKMEGAASEILIKDISDKELNSVKSRINELLNSNGFNSIQAVNWQDIGLGYSMIRMADISYTLMAVFFFILSSSVIANTMLMVVFERKKEIGTITALGMTSGEVVRLFFLEALVLGVLGAGAGVLLGIIIVIPLSYIGIDLSSMEDIIEFGTSWNIYPQLTLKSTLVVFFYSVFVASIISFFPSRSSSRVDPVEALRAD